MMNYKQTLKFLYNNLPMFQREGEAAFKPGLENTYLLLKKTGNPHKKFKSIHIAGTNGKGSVSHMLCGILMKAGYKTGLYTSPHLMDYRERIRINGKKIKKKFIVEFINKISPLCKELRPSFFEVTVTMAFKYFAMKKVDIAIIETGMGGRLDSTNVLTPILSIITNIGLDHTQYLGNTLPLIAIEKAGIIKKKIPLVIGETHPETKQVFEKEAYRKKTKAVFADLHFSSKIVKQDVDLLEIKIKKNGNKYLNNIITDINSNYQCKNIVTTVCSLEELQKQGYKIKKKHITKGLINVKQRTGLMGRWDIVQKNPYLIIDTAHNAEGLFYIEEQLKLYNYKKLYIVFGLVKEKDTEHILASLPKDAFYFFTKALMPRSMEVKDLYQIASVHSLKGVTCASVQVALMYTKNMADEDDLILVTGSNFIVAEAFKSLGNKG